MSVVPSEIGLEAAPERHAVVRRVQVDVLVLHRPLGPFHQDVVQGPSFAVHADPNPMPLELPEKGLGGELGALIGTEDLRWGRNTVTPPAGIQAKSVSPQFGTSWKNGAG